MSFKVIHPGQPLHPRYRLLSRTAAIRSENHVPSPEDLRLNIFTDASPVSKRGLGGVGIGHGRWLPTQPSSMTQSLSYVVTELHNSNECELLALAEAALVVSDEIKDNITTLRENDWKIRVMIWSDSRTALQSLKEPNCFARFRSGRPTKICIIILKIISEMESLPIRGPIELIWMPGLSTKMHKTADFMTKNPNGQIWQSSNLTGDDNDDVSKAHCRPSCCQKGCAFSRFSLECRHIWTDDS